MDDLPPCDQEIFRNGKSLLAADTGMREDGSEGCRATGFDAWIQAIRVSSGQRVDWHYSGGVAHVLFLGDRAKILDAIQAIPCPARIMRYFEETDPGLFRNGVTPVPPGAIAAFYEGGSGSTFI